MVKSKNKCGTKICIAGLGNMGSAIMKILRAKKIYEVSGFDRSSNHQDEMRLLAKCDVLILAVKPQDFENLAKKIRKDLKDGMGEKLVVSIMAGMPIKNIQKFLGGEKVVRVMPNLPLKYEAGVSGWFASKEVSKEEKICVKKMLGFFGEEIEVKKEDEIDKITALSGSGPAYYYFLNKCLQDKALKMGFSAKAAEKISRGTFIGAAALMQNEKLSGKELISKIASKGGTTAAALAHFENKKLDKTISEGVEKAYIRAKQLSK